MGEDWGTLTRLVRGRAVLLGLLFPWRCQYFSFFFHETDAVIDPRGRGSTWTHGLRRPYAWGKNSLSSCPCSSCLCSVNTKPHSISVRDEPRGRVLETPNVTSWCTALSNLKFATEISLCLASSLSMYLMGMTSHWDSNQTPIHDPHGRLGENKLKAGRAFPMSRMRGKHYWTEN